MSSKQRRELTIRDETSGFLLYSTDSGTVKVEVLLGEETVWLTINRMAGLFGVDKSTVSRHLKNIYESGELERAATVAKIATVQIEGEREVCATPRILQPRRHHLRRLPRQFPPGHPLPHSDPTQTPLNVEIRPKSVQSQFGKPVRHQFGA